MLAEWRDLDGDSLDSARWLFDCLVGAAALRARDGHSRRTMLVVAMGAPMIAIDWSTEAVAPSLLVLGAMAAALGFLAPSRVGGCALFAGGILPLAHGVANASPALWPFYQYKPLDPRDWAILISLFVPAAAAAAAGAMMARICGERA